MTEVATNEAALNSVGQTSDVTRTAGNAADIQEIEETGSGLIATGDAPEANENAVTTAIPSTEDAIAEASASTLETQEEIETLAEDRIAEDEEIKEENIKIVENLADTKTDIIEEKDEALEEVGEKASDFSQSVTDQMVDSLEKQKELALEKWNLELEEQKITNQQAIDTAEQKVIIEEQKATWAMNKLGLWFGSGIIQEVQAIATRGATEIAKLKVTAKKLEVDTSLNISKLEFEYSKEINSLISANLETQLSLDETTAQRIADTQNSFLLTETEKAAAINDIEAEYLTSSRSIEDSLRDDQERLTDKYTTQVIDFNNRIEEQKNNWKVKINDGISSWAIYNATTAELVSMASEAWISLNELNSIKTNVISGEIISTAQVAMEDSGFIFKQAEKLIVINDAKELMSSGVDFKTAVQSTTIKMLEWNPEYKAIAENKGLKLKAEKASLNNALSPSSTLTKSEQKSWDTVQKIDDQWHIINFNQITWESTFVPDPVTWEPAKARETSSPKSSIEEVTALLNALKE